MSTSFDEFKECCRIQANLDLEAIDVAFIEPLKDLHAWWTRQADFTKGFATFLGGTALVAFIAKIAQTTAAALATAFAEAVGAAIVGISLAVFMDVLVRCKIQEVEAIVG